MIKSTHPDFEHLIRYGAVTATPAITGFLEDLGVGFSVSGGQLSLDDQLEFLDDGLLEDISADLNHEPPGALQLEVHRVTGSTNDVVMSRLDDPANTCMICTAEMQTAGRGRRGRRWVSPFGRNIYLTIGRFLSREISELGGLSQVVGIQVVDALRNAGVDRAALKWPNDILLDGGKLGGILVELRPADGRGVGIVVGVGINLWLQENDAADIEQPWRAVASSDLSRRALLVEMTSRILNAIHRFEQEGFGVFAPLWDNYNAYNGRQVSIIRGEEIFKGIDSGVDGSGNLRLVTTEGEQLHNSGEVSMRPVDEL